MQLHYLNSLTSLRTNGANPTLPTFFLKEGIQGLVDLETEIPHGLEIQLHLVGTLCLSAITSSSHYGSLDLQHHQIDSRTILDVAQDLPVTRSSTPFHLEVADALTERMDLPSSLRAVSRHVCAQGSLKAASLPMMVASVTYVLEATVRRLGLEECRFSQEIRLLNSPLGTDDCLKSNDTVKIACLQQRMRLPTQIFSRSHAARDENITIEISAPNNLNFVARSDAAAGEVIVKTTIRNGLASDKVPTPLRLAVAWNLQSITELAMSDTMSLSQDTSIGLSSRLLSHTNILKHEIWQPNQDADGTVSSWSSTSSFWITEPLHTFLAPSFRTTYLAHTHALQFHVKAERGSHFHARKAELEFSSPIAITYDHGALPSYAGENAPPEYLGLERTRELNLQNTARAIC